MTAVQIPPFSYDAELVRDQSNPLNGAHIPVPNEPFVSASAEAVTDYLRREVECKVLDELAPYFFVFAKRRASHIDTLHEYDSTDRSVTISENPGLHLVRNYSVIYCKPIPHCLLNYAFWSTYLAPQGKDSGQCTFSSEDLSIECKSALGLLRTYTYLIKHQSDFRVAQKVGLVPEGITYTRFQHFIEPFKRLPDTAVSPRYQYGHIRLTRLNLAVRIVRPPALGKVFPWSYDRMHWHSGQYIGRFAAPLLFFFACLTLILGSMQVGLAALPTGDNWDILTKISLYFSVAIILGIIGMALLVVLGIGLYVANRVFVGYVVHKKWAGRKRKKDVEYGSE